MLNSGVEEFVDLGLSVLWAKGNICKDSSGKYYVGKSTDQGCYFSWGNIEGHNRGDGYEFGDSNYNSSPGASLTANIASNDSAHDAALACLGDGYRMPTKAEFDELINNCDNMWVDDYNGVDRAGMVFTSKIAGYTDKEIFIPASGYGSDSGLWFYGSNAFYWSSTYYNNRYVYKFYFSDDNLGTNRDLGRYGMPVRAVKDK